MASHVTIPAKSETLLAVLGGLIAVLENEAELKEGIEAELALTLTNELYESASLLWSRDSEQGLRLKAFALCRALVASLRECMTAANGENLDQAVWRAPHDAFYLAELAFAMLQPTQETPHERA